MQIPHLRWVIAGMLFLATMINYADRLALSVVSTDLRTEFAMTEQDYSHVVALFMVAYAIMYAGSGYVLDRLGTRKGFAVFIFTWSVAAMGHALSFGKWSLGAWRFLLGLGEPGNFPAAAKAIAEWFPARQRALGVGIFNAGSSAGSALAPPVVAFLTLRYGWRFAFVFTGALGLVWLVFWLLLYQPPHRNRWITRKEFDELKDQVRPPAEAEPSRTRTDWRGVLAQRGCYSLILARFFTDPVIYFVIFWLPEYLRKERGFDLEMVGKYAWVPFIFADIGYIFGGWLSGKLMHRGWTLARARRFCLGLGALMLPAAIAAPLVPNAASALAAICLVTFGHAVWISNLLTLPTDLFPGQEIGTATGFSGMGGAIGGILANLGTGWVVQRFSYAPIFMLAGLMHPLSFTLLHRLLPEREFRKAAARIEAGQQARS
jgi:ACS family hexuronate transporter-like MFS transporter